ncbi:16S rRNA processing protein RimM [bacterium]|nr:MAG: 16S rRNA processing protein RimM [bacterium]
MDDLENLRLVKETGGMEPQIFSIKSVRAHKNGMIVKSADIKDRNQAETLKGLIVEVPEEFLTSETGEQIYLREILGFTVVTKAQGEIGQIEKFSSNVAQDLLVVNTASGTFEIPFVEAFVEKLTAPSPSQANDTQVLVQVQTELDSLAARENQLIEGQLRAISAGADSGVYEKMLSALTQNRRDLKEKQERLMNAPFSPTKASHIKKQLEQLRGQLQYESLVPGTEPFQDLHNLLVALFESIQFKEKFEPDSPKPRWKVVELEFNWRS